MNIYTQKRRWKLFLLLSAIFIGTFSLFYTHELTDELKKSEKKKMVLWAEAIRVFNLSEAGEESMYLDLISMVITNNTTIPVIVTDENDSILSHNNIPVPDNHPEPTIRKRLVQMKRNSQKYTHYQNIEDSIRATGNKSIRFYYSNAMKYFYSDIGRIEIDLGDHEKQYLYYDDSILLNRLSWFPLIQLLVVSVFIVVAYLAFSGARKAEQDQVWVGMAKETAHQLGTPTSSLLAWIDLLKLKDSGLPMLEEMKSDVQRLRTITDRFSKIGAMPELIPYNINELFEKSVSYLKKRTSSHVEFRLQPADEKAAEVHLNPTLFEWIIENICKNAIDAMEGKGTITISIKSTKKQMLIDISDTGKGIPKSLQKTIFEPGFTTKKRGWGLGLSLVKRIVEQYHHGKVFILDSHVNAGTTFRIVLQQSRQLT